jgi:sortase A
VTKDKKSRRSLRKLITVLLIMAAFVLMFYPFISNFLYENTAGSVVASLSEAASSGDKEETEEMKEEIEKARQYNERLAQVRVQLGDPFDEEQNIGTEGNYNNLLNMTETGIMGYIEIPVIEVSLPIYHGTSSEVLEQGAGHLEGSSLPVGGNNTNSVITGHTGLSNARLFTDLIELEKGDVFFLYIMNESLAYKVDQIKVVEPSHLDDLYIKKDKDYCTLVTCTPYGINSHRLIVRGERTDYDFASKEAANAGVKTSESMWMKEYKEALFISLTALIVCLLAVFLIRKVRKRKKNRNKEKKQAKESNL